MSVGLFRYLTMEKMSAKRGVLFEYKTRYIHKAYSTELFSYETSE